MYLITVNKKLNIFFTNVVIATNTDKIRLKDVLDRSEK